MDGMTMAVALVALCGALCGADLALIWQVLRLTDRVDDLDADMHATVMWLIHREARRMREDGDGDGEED